MGKLQQRTMLLSRAVWHSEACNGPSHLWELLPLDALAHVGQSSFLCHFLMLSILEVRRHSSLSPNRLQNVYLHAPCSRTEEVYMLSEPAVEPKVKHWLTLTLGYSEEQFHAIRYQHDLIMIVCSKKRSTVDTKQSISTRITAFTGRQLVLKPYPLIVEAIKTR